MKKIILNQKEKRFLIIWIGICLFAFFVNTAPIRGKVNTGFYIWTAAPDIKEYRKDFYPFTKFTESVKGVVMIGLPNSPYNVKPHTRFNGIFNSFDAPELIVYILLGLIITYIPKIW